AGEVAAHRAAGHRHGRAHPRHRRRCQARRLRAHARPRRRGRGDRPHLLRAARGHRDGRPDHRPQRRRDQRRAARRQRRGGRDGARHAPRRAGGERVTTTTTAAPRPTSRPLHRRSVVRSIPLIYLALLVILAVGTVILATNGENLFSAGSVVDILTRSSLLGFIAIGQTLVILCRSLDLSVGYVAA